MATTKISATQHSISQDTFLAGTSPKACKGSTSFFESMSPWSTRSQGMAAASPSAKGKEAEACAALLEEVFRPDEPQKKTERNVEAPFLPRLLDRVGLSAWSGAPTKNLDTEVQTLKGRQSAAAKLLEQVEKETEYINQQLQEKTQQAKVQGHKSFFGLACTNCGPSLDANEINMQASRPVQDVIELRPTLRNRVKECEQALVERDAELRQLRHEIQLLRSEKEMIRQVEKDAVLDGAANSKDALVQRYGAAFSLVDGSHLKVAFHAWRHHVQRRALRERMLKTTSLALASDSARQKSLLFAYWQTLVRDKRDAQKLQKERQRLTIGQSYAAKFAMQADSTTMRAIIIEWWRVSKECALQAHLATEKAKQDAGRKETTASTPLASAQKQGAGTDKACCALM